MAQGKKTGGGSRKGIPNKHKQSFRAQLNAYCEQLGVDPHRYMADLIASTEEVVIGVDAEGQVVKRPAVSAELKFNAARELAPYLQPKLKAIEHSGDVDHTLKVIEHRYGRSRTAD